MWAYWEPITQAVLIALLCPVALFGGKHFTKKITEHAKNEQMRLRWISIGWTTVFIGCTAVGIILSAVIFHNAKRELHRIMMWCNIGVILLTNIAAVVLYESRRREIYRQHVLSWYLERLEEDREDHLLLSDEKPSQTLTHDILLNVVKSMFPLKSKVISNYAIWLLLPTLLSCWIALYIVVSSPSVQENIARAEATTQPTTRP